jgi:hypothetical protein
MSSVAVDQRRWTSRDLVALPEDCLRHELLDGEHVVTPSPGTAHQMVLRELFRRLDAHVVAHRLGEVLFAPYDIKLSLFTVLRRCSRDMGFSEVITFARPRVDVLESPLFPGLRIPLAHVFREGRRASRGSVAHAAARDASRTRCS